MTQTGVMTTADKMHAKNMHLPVGAKLRFGDAAGRAHVMVTDVLNLYVGYVQRADQHIKIYDLAAIGAQGRVSIPQRERIGVFPGLGAYFLTPNLTPVVRRPDPSKEYRPLSGSFQLQAMGVSNYPSPDFGEAHIFPIPPNSPNGRLFFEMAMNKTLNSNRLIYLGTPLMVDAAEAQEFQCTF